MDSQLKKPSTNSVGNWVQAEDEIILRYVYEKDRNNDNMMWGNLQATLNGRSGKSCRERWFNHLDPKIKRTEWSVEEQWVLFILRNQQVEKWSLISKRLMGRTDNAVKNYWNSRLRKRINNMQKAYDQHFERKKKQKIIQMIDAAKKNSAENLDKNKDTPVKSEDLQKMTVQDLEKYITEEQRNELDASQVKAKADYLTKILEQIAQQNQEYYTNLASEYTIQLEKLKNEPNEPNEEQKLILKSFKMPKRNPSPFYDDEYMDEEEDEDQQKSYIISNPDILKMHLDILYKTVDFLDQDQIVKNLPDYVEGKRQKIEQENKRMNDTTKKAIVKPGTAPKKEGTGTEQVETSAPEEKPKAPEKAEATVGKSQKKKIVVTNQQQTENSPDAVKPVAAPVAEKSKAKNPAPAASKTPNKVGPKEKKDTASTAVEGSQSKSTKKVKAVTKQENPKAAKAPKKSQVERKVTREEGQQASGDASEHGSSDLSDFSKESDASARSVRNKKALQKPVKSIQKKKKNVAKLFTCQKQDRSSLVVGQPIKDPLVKSLDPEVADFEAAEPSPTAGANPCAFESKIKDLKIDKLTPFKGSMPQRQVHFNIAQGSKAQYVKFGSDIKATPAAAPGYKQFVTASTNAHSAFGQYTSGDKTLAMLKQKKLLKHQLKQKKLNKLLEKQKNNTDFKPTYNKRITRSQSKDYKSCDKKAMSSDVSMSQEDDEQIQIQPFNPEAFGNGKQINPMVSDFQAVEKINHEKGASQNRFSTQNAPSFGGQNTAQLFQNFNDTNAISQFGAPYFNNMNTGQDGGFQKNQFGTQNFSIGNPSPFQVPLHQVNQITHQAAQVGGVHANNVSQGFPPPGSQGQNQTSHIQSNANGQPVQHNTYQTITQNIYINMDPQNASGQNQQYMLGGQNTMIRPDFRSNWPVRAGQAPDTAAAKTNATGSHDMYGSGQSIHHPMHDMQIQALENTINQLNQPGKEEDEFMIRKDLNTNKKHFLTQSNNQSSSIDDPLMTRKQRRRNQKKFKYSKCFMNMTMAQMVKNREVDPLVAQNAPGAMTSRNASLSPSTREPASKRQRTSHNIINPVPMGAKCESPVNKKKINPEINGLLTPMLDKSPFTAKITRAERGAFGQYNSPAINKFSSKK